jgi:hypothetical protein
VLYELYLLRDNIFRPFVFPRAAQTGVTSSRVSESHLDFVRIGSRPFQEISPKSVWIGSRAPLPLLDLSLMFPLLGYKNRRPMFPLSFRLVLSSHYTITFTLIVQSYSSQHASIQNFHCVTPFCCHFFSSYCFTVALFKRSEWTCLAHSKPERREFIQIARSSGRPDFKLVSISLVRDIRGNPILI